MGQMKHGYLPQLFLSSRICRHFVPNHTFPATPLPLGLADADPVSPMANFNSVGIHTDRFISVLTKVYISRLVPAERRPVAEFCTACFSSVLRSPKWYHRTSSHCKHTLVPNRAQGPAPCVQSDKHATKCEKTQSTGGRMEEASCEASPPHDLQAKKYTEGLDSLFDEIKDIEDHVMQWAKVADYGTDDMDRTPSREGEPAARSREREGGREGGRARDSEGGKSAARREDPPRLPLGTASASRGG
eukprot:2354056-Rhodomonas_salina.1